MERKSGFYWVKTAIINSGKWIAVEYSNGKWRIGSGAGIGDDCMTEINENRIMSPDEWE